MRMRFANQALLGIVLICPFSVCFAAESPDPNDPNRYLNAIRTFADNVLKYGRDTYGPKHTPLFVDAAESTGSVTKKQPVPMDAICDLSLFGEKIGDDAHTTTTGDVDNDGYVDLIVGAHGHNSNQGRAYLYYGSPSGLSSRADLIFEGEPGQNSHFGWLLGSGDVDGDSYDDIIIGAADYDNLRGRAFLYYGGPRTTMDTRADLLFEGENAGDRFCVGWDDVACDDIDGDSYDDIVIPAIGYDNYRGRAYLYWGNARARMDAKADLTFSPHDPGGGFGFGLDCGDVDCDGYKEVVIGARTDGTNKCGRAYLYWGDTQTNMDSDCDLFFEAETTNRDGFGANVGIDDIDHDGFEDILIGANTFNKVQGRAYLYWGTTRAKMDTDCDLKFTGEAGRGGFAELCICDGDVNADGYADILIGARQYDNGRGRAYLYLGGTKERMDAQAELILTGENEGDWFGDPPGGNFGDFNNDGYDDLAIGARKWQSNTEQGRVYIYHGGSTILASDALRKLEKGLTKSLHRTLHVAAFVGDMNKVKALIREGADINVKDSDGYTPLHFAVQSGQNNTTKFLIAKGADIDAKDNRGKTPLQVAKEKGNTEIVELLHKHGAKK